MKSFLFVGIQFGAIGFLLWYGGIFGGVASNLLLISGIGIGLLAVLTMRFRVSIFPEVRPNQELCTGGIYRFIRHPMYLAVLLMAGAWVLHRPDIVSIGVWMILLVDLLMKLSYEERELSRKFPTYEEYRKISKRLIPWVY